MDYWFDATNRIDEVDGSWWEFAKTNGAAQLAPEAVLGLPLSVFITDIGTELIWARLLERARTGVVIDFELRCDAPDRRRNLALKVSPDGDRVKIRSVVVSEMPRPPVWLLDPVRIGTGMSICSCSWCKKFELQDAWVEVESFVESTKLFDRREAPPITHGICPSCLVEIRGLIEKRAETGADSAGGGGADNS